MDEKKLLESMNHDHPMMVIKCIGGEYLDGFCTR